MPDKVQQHPIPRAPNQKLRLHPDIAGAGIILSVTLIWLADPWLRPGHLSPEGDTLLLFYPAMDYAHTELLEGRIPLWNPYKFMGAPFLANLMVPVFYPPVTLSLLFPQPFGMYLCLTLHILLAGLLTYGCARKAFGISISGSVFTGLSFCLSAPLLCHATHMNQLVTMSWLPGILWCILRFGSSNRWFRDFFISVLVLSMMFLAGHPQIIFFSGMIIFWAGCVKILNPGLCANRKERCGSEIRTESTPSRVKLLLVLGGVFLTALGISAIHWMNAIELASYSIRILQGTEFGISYSLPPRNLITLFLPDHFGSPGTTGYLGEGNFTETSIFCGPLAPLLAMIALTWKRCPLRLMSSGLILSGTLVALGGNTPFYPMLLDFSDWMGRFRAPARAFCIPTLMICLLAGQGLDRLASFTRSSGWISSWIKPAHRLHRITLTLVILFQFAGLAWFRFHLLDLEFHDLDLTRGPPLKRSLKHENWNRGRFYREFMSGVPIDDKSITATRLKWSVFQPDLNTFHGIRLFYGYEEGMLPQASLILGARFFRGNLYSPAPDTTLLGLLGIEYLITDKPIVPAIDPESGQPDLKLVHKDRFFVVYANTKYRGQIYSRLDFPGVDFEIMHDAFSAEKATEKIRLLTDDIITISRQGNSSLKWNREGPSTFHVYLENLDVQEIILTESWMPGWKALMPNHTEVKGKRLGPFLTTFEIPDGTEYLLIRYQPDSWIHGRTVSLITLLAALISLFAGTKRRPTCLNGPKIESKLI